MASLLEHAVVVGIGAALVTGVATSDVSEQFEDGVREAVCLVRGPDCEGETWTEHDRPDPPEDPPAAYGGGVEPKLDLDDLENADVAPVIEFALAQRGKPYLWGGNGPNAWDCSGIVQAAYRQIGVNTPRVTTGYYAKYPHVGYGAMIPGDLVFLNMGSNRPKPDHMGLYIGHDQMMHCGNPCRVVDLTSSYWQQRFMNGSRVVQS